MDEGLRVENGWNGWGSDVDVDVERGKGRGRGEETTRLTRLYTVAANEKLDSLVCVC